MTRFVLLFLLIALLGACGNDPAEEVAGQSTSGDSKTSSDSKSRSRQPKWEFNVEGRPAISGRVITGVTMGAFGNYSMAGSDSTISVRVTQDNPNTSITIKYNDDGVRCMNFGDATIIPEGDRAVVSGEVGCWAPDQSAENHSQAAIQGWFELKK